MITSTLAWKSEPFAAWLTECANRAQDFAQPGAHNGYPVEPHPSGVGVVAKGVEVFEPVERFNPGTKQMDVFDEDYCRRGIQQFQTRRAEGYLPPMHTRHIPKNGGAAQNRLAGHIDNLYEGQAADGTFRVMADLWFTQPDVFKEVEQLAWPFRSIEILDPSRAEFSSLALLDYNVPYFKFPLTRVDTSNAQHFCAELHDGSIEFVQMMRGDQQQFAGFPPAMDDDETEDVDGGDPFGADPEMGGEDEDLLMMLLEALGAGDPGDTMEDGPIMANAGNQGAAQNVDGLIDRIATATAEKLGNSGGMQVSTENTAPPMAAQQPANHAQDFAQIAKEHKALVGSNDELRREVATLRKIIAGQIDRDNRAYFSQVITQAGAQHFEALLDQFQLTEEQQDVIVADFAQWRAGQVDHAMQQFSQDRSYQPQPDFGQWVAKWQQVLAGSTIGSVDVGDDGVAPAAAVFTQGATSAAAAQFTQEDVDCKAIFQDLPRATPAQRSAAMSAAKEWDGSKRLQSMCSRAGYIQASID